MVSGDSRVSVLFTPIFTALPFGGTAPTSVMTTVDPSQTAVHVRSRVGLAQPGGHAAGDFRSVEHVPDRGRCAGERARQREGRVLVSDADLRTIIRESRPACRRVGHAWRRGPRAGEVGPLLGARVASSRQERGHTQNGCPMSHLVNTSVRTIARGRNAGLDKCDVGRSAIGARGLGLKAQGGTTFDYVLEDLA